MAVNAFREESKESGNPRGEIGDVQIFNEIQGVHSGKQNVTQRVRGTRNEKMYFLLERGIFQPAMLVYQRVDDYIIYVYVLHIAHCVHG